MVYNHTLTFVTVFIWRDLFFGYKLVTNWLHQTSLRLHSGSWVAVFMCVRALLAFKAKALDAEEKLEFVKDFNAQLGLAPYRYKMYRLDNEMNIAWGVPAPGDE